MLDLRGRKCLVAGGGRIALRKVIGLLRTQASVTVVSPEFNKRFNRFSHLITMVQKGFDIQDIPADCAIVIAATNVQDVNKIIFDQARELNIPCNVVDQPDLCSFIVPAVIRRGDISVAVSTNASSPRFSKYIKMKIAETLTMEYAQIAAFLSDVRILLKNQCPDQRKRFAIWEMIFEDEPLECVKNTGIEIYRQDILKKIEKILDKQVII
jgi:siroheme synthase-like protein